MKEITVQIDTREQYPLLFPDTIVIPSDSNKDNSTTLFKIKQQKIKLDAGDYRLAEYPSSCIFERKGSQSELIKNLFDQQDSIRTAKAFTRLVESCSFPYLLIECTPSSLLQKTPLLNHPELLINKLALVTAKYNLRLLWTTTPTSVSARRALGTVLLHTMYALRPPSEI
jgi:ERCC4-type nuclease